MSIENAPAPDAMREELINIAQGKAISRSKAEALVDAMLQKQMEFYSMMAEPELTVDSNTQILTVAAVQGAALAVITQGAEFTQFMSDANKTKWAGNAARLRESVAKLLEMFT